MEMRYEEEEEERWPYWPAGLLNSDFEQFLVQSLAAQLQVHPSATWWVTTTEQPSSSHPDNSVYGRW
jgi:hypothetical protein